MRCLIVGDDAILASTLSEMLDIVLLDYRPPDGTSLDLSSQVGLSCPNSPSSC